MSTRGLMDFSARVKSVRPGTPYVLAILRSDQEYLAQYDRLVCRVALARAGRRCRRHCASTRSIVGRVGERPVLVESQDRPYRVRVTLEPFDFDMRMESWLPTDTIRRAGFGHVIVNRQPRSDPGTGHQLRCPGTRRAAHLRLGLFAPVRGTFAGHPNAKSLIPNPSPVRACYR